MPVPAPARPVASCRPVACGALSVAWGPDALLGASASSSSASALGGSAGLGGGGGADVPVHGYRVLRTRLGGSGGTADGAVANANATPAAADEHAEWEVVFASEGNADDRQFVDTGLDHVLGAAYAYKVEAWNVMGASGPALLPACRPGSSATGHCGAAGDGGAADPAAARRAAALPPAATAEGALEGGGGGGVVAWAFAALAWALWLVRLPVRLAWWSLTEGATLATLAVLAWRLNVRYKVFRPLTPRAGPAGAGGAAGGGAWWPRVTRRAVTATRAVGTGLQAAFQAVSAPLTPRNHAGGRGRFAGEMSWYERVRAGIAQRMSPRAGAAPAPDARGDGRAASPPPRLHLPPHLGRGDSGGSGRGNGATTTGGGGGGAVNARRPDSPEAEKARRRWGFVRRKLLGRRRRHSIGATTAASPRTPVPAAPELGRDASGASARSAGSGSAHDAALPNGGGGGGGGSGHTAAALAALSGGGPDRGSPALSQRSYDSHGSWTGGGSDSPASSVRSPGGQGGHGGGGPVGPQAVQSSKHCFACGRHVGGRHRYRRHYCGNCDGVFCAKCMAHTAHRFGSCGIVSRCICSVCWDAGKRPDA